MLSRILQDESTHVNPHQVQDCVEIILLMKAKCSDITCNKLMKYYTANKLFRCPTKITQKLFIL